MGTCGCPTWVGVLCQCFLPTKGSQQGGLHTLPHHLAAGRASSRLCSGGWKAARLPAPLPSCPLSKQKEGQKPECPGSGTQPVPYGFCSGYLVKSWYIPRGDGWSCSSQASNFASDGNRQVACYPLGGQGETESRAWLGKGHSDAFPRPAWTAML
jgi:hypothetical protein